MIRLSLLPALIIIACSIFARHLFLGDINWHHESIELAYYVRGWWPSFTAQLNTFTQEQTAWLVGTFGIFLWSAISIYRSTEK